MKIKINPKLFLQGPLINPAISNLMNDNLRTLGYLPTTSPYADGATCDASVFNVAGNDAIVDWVWVELRSSNDNTKIVNARSALLQRDGDVVAVDGLSNLQMLASPQGYYVIVNHRNHLGAMSNSVIALNDQTAILVDFTDTGFTTYGNNARIVLSDGAMALWSGDTNEMNIIRFLGADSSISAIKDRVLADPSNGFGSISYSSMGYYNTDLDLNGGSKYTGSGNDTNIVRDNVLSHPGNGFGSPFAIRTDSDLAQLAAIRAGIGIGACQLGLASRDPELVRVLPDEFIFDLEVWVAMHEDLRAIRRMRLMFDHLSRELAAYVATSGR